MSNLATRERLRQSTSQLPVSWYNDPALLEIERKVLFDCGPGYVGHELMVPNVGDYHTLAWRDNAQVLVRNDRGVELLSNICRHRQAIMLTGRGSTSNIVCPIHRWTYRLDGTVLRHPRKSPFSASIRSAGLKPGAHTLRIKLSPRTGKARTVTMRLQLGGC